MPNISKEIGNHPATGEQFTKDSECGEKAAKHEAGQRGPTGHMGKATQRNEKEKNQEEVKCPAICGEYCQRKKPQDAIPTAAGAASRGVDTPGNQRETPSTQSSLLEEHRKQSLLS